MLVVDSQVHIWTEGKPSPHHRQQPFGALDLITAMDEAGVTSAVLVPPTWDPNGNTPSLRASATWPDRFAVMGQFDFEGPNAKSELRRWRSQAGMLGVRVGFNSVATRKRLIEGAADWFWAEAEALDMPVMVMAPGLLPWMAEIARRHRRLRLVIDHLAIPRGAKAAAAFEHLPELLAMARYPNVAVKATGLPGYAVNEPFPFASLHAPLREVFDAFGAQRMFWGTDLSRMPVPYRECVEMFTQGIPWLKGEDCATVMGLGLCRWLGWTPTLSAASA
jgi:predicted TIM-barrel fold metal-dependent hydrolase